ncbi:hypothetical protein AMTRI_Chr09g15260 [Amborella trichopoda]
MLNLTWMLRWCWFLDPIYFGDYLTIVDEKLRDRLLDFSQIMRSNYCEDHWTFLGPIPAY